MFLPVTHYLAVLLITTCAHTGLTTLPKALRLPWRHSEPQGSVLPVAAKPVGNRPSDVGMGPRLVMLRCFWRRGLGIQAGFLDSGAAKW